MNEEARHYKYYHRWNAIAVRHGFESVDVAIRTLYERGETSGTLGQLFDVTAPTIVAQLKRMGVTLRGKGGKNNLKGRKATYYVKGVPLKKYCQQQNISYPMVWNRVYMLGWSLLDAVRIPKHT